ncbi:MAG: SufE family protein [Pseudomonadota bacterium]
MAIQTPSLNTIREDFAFLDEWEDRYRYVIELGKALPPLAADERNEATKVTGCASQVWLIIDRTPDGALILRGESDAMIVQGLIAILTAIYSGRTPQDILSSDARAVFDDFDLSDHLTQQRANGLASMIGRVRALAELQLADGAPAG